MNRQMIGFGRSAAFGTLALVVLLTTGCHRDPNKQKQKYLESGKRYAADAKYKEAAIQFSNALKVDRNFAEAHYQLGDTYLKMGSVMPGYSELTRAVALQPGNQKARLDLGNLLLAGRQYDRAAEQANDVLSLNSQSADAHALLSSIAAGRNDRPEAIAQIQQALALDPKRAQFHAALGLLQSGDPALGASSEDQLRQAIALDGKSALAHLALAAELDRKGDKGAALDQYKAAVTGDPKSLMARGALAEFYLRQNDTQNVESTLRQATDDLSATPGGAELLQNFYLRTNQLGKGVQAYADLVAKHPKSVELRLVYTRFLLATKNTEKARSIVADLMKSDGSNPDVGTLNGIMLLNDGKVNDAVDALQKSAKNNPESVSLKLWLGRAALRKSDFSLAQQSFSDASKLSPANVEARDGLAQVAISKKDPTLLRDVGDSAIKANPGNAIGYLWRGMAESSTQPEQAETDLREAMKLDPKNWAAALELGGLKLSQKKISEARPLLEQALAANPNSDRAVGLLVSADLMEKQPQKALNRLQAQVARSPNNGQMYVELSEVQMQVGDRDGALASAQKAVELAPSNGGAVMAYSRAAIARGQAQQAIDAWQNYLKVRPSDAQGYAVLGSLQQSRSDNDAAIASYKKALTIQPEQPVAANNLAYLMVEGGQNTDVALNYAQMARRELPNAPSTADTLAWVYYAKGTYTSARDLLEEAAKAAPDDAAIQYHLGMTYQKLSDQASATTHLKKAISLSPDSSVGKDAQKALGQSS